MEKVRLYLAVLGLVVAWFGLGVVIGFAIG
jgi:hypothetical protein